MKENMFDVLIYLFENYLEDEIEILPDTDVIRSELVDAGFALPEVSKAFNWLESLSLLESMDNLNASFRIFAKFEQQKLDRECQSLLLSLEHTGILSPALREIVIESAMRLEIEKISLEELKWIVLMVLLSQSDDEVAFSRMESIVYDLVPAYLH